MIPSVIVPITHKEIFKAARFYPDNGDKIQEFEKKFSEFIGSRYAIATSSGISALYVLLKAYGLKKGDEVIVPAYTCESVPRLVIDMGLKINFVDVGKKTYNIDVEDLHQKISENTDAIIAIHMFGNPCEIDKIKKIGEEYNTVVIEDAAQSIGAEYLDKKIGTIGDAGFFSLGEGKPLTTINGGVIVTNNSDLAEKCRNVIQNFDHCGFSRKITLFTKLMTYFLLNNPYNYGLVYRYINNRRVKRRESLKTNSLTNYKFKYSDMQASVGMVQMANLEKFNSLRIKNSNFLMEHLSHLDSVHLPQISKNSKPIFLRLPVRFENKDLMEKSTKRLNEAGIDAPVAYPNSLPKFFLGLEGYPNTEEVVKKTITLPTHPLVNQNSLENIVEVLEGVSK